jgi:hypothetical protein
VTLEEVVEVITPMALALRVQLDVPTFRAYHLYLKDVPVGVAALALENLSRTGLTFMPTAPEIRSASEKARRQQLALNPWSACAECESQAGWRTITDGRGDTRVERCPCKKRHQERIAGLGLLDAIAALPGEAEKESEQVFPTVQQLPEHLRKQVTAAAARKALR